METETPYVFPCSWTSLPSSEWTQSVVLPAWINVWVLAYKAKSMCTLHCLNQGGRAIKSINVSQNGHALSNVWNTEFTECTHNTQRHSDEKNLIKTNQNKTHALTGFSICVEQVTEFLMV